MIFLIVVSGRYFSLSITNNVGLEGDFFRERQRKKKGGGKKGEKGK